MDSGTTLQRGGILLTTEGLKVNGRVYPLTQNARVEEIARAPRLLLTVPFLVIGTLGLPAALWFNGITPEDFSWVVAFPISFLLGAGYRLLTAEAKYTIVLKIESQEIPLFESGDHQLTAEVVAALREALAVSSSSEVASNHSARA